MKWKNTTQSEQFALYTNEGALLVILFKTYDDYIVAMKTQTFLDTVNDKEKFRRFKGKTLQEMRDFYSTLARFRGFC